MAKKKIDESAPAEAAGIDAEAGPEVAPKVSVEPGPKPVDAEVPPVSPAEKLAEEPVAAADAGIDPRTAVLAKEVGSLKDQLLRAMAETENTRRRLTKERDDSARFGASSFAKDMLSVADNLHRALEAMPEGALEDDAPLKALADGLKLTEDELLKAFERHGIVKIDPYGEKFDHNLHQAMLQLENTGKPAGTVAQVLAPGYVMHDRLLRPAMVGVAKGEAADKEADKDSRVDTTA